MDTGPTTKTELLIIFPQIFYDFTHFIFIVNSIRIVTQCKQNYVKFQIILFYTQIYDSMVGSFND